MSWGLYMLALELTNFSRREAGERLGFARQMHTHILLRFMLLISQRLDAEGYRAIRGQEGEDSTLVGRVGRMCRCVAYHTSSELIRTKNQHPN